MMKMLLGWHVIVMMKIFCLHMGNEEVISIQWFHTANNGMISQMTSSFSSKLLQTPPPSSKWWVISYYNTTNAFIGMHSLCLWGSGLILAETREDPFTLYADEGVIVKLLPRVPLAVIRLPQFHSVIMGCDFIYYFHIWNHLQDSTRLVEDGGGRSWRRNSSM